MFQSTPAKKSAQEEEISPIKGSSEKKKVGPATQIDKGVPKIKDPKEIVKKYKMVEGSYRIRVRIYEGTDIVPSSTVGSAFFGNKNGSANPFVQVELLNMTKRTTVKKKTLFPVWDEQFFFDFEHLNKVQLDEAAMVFSLMDHNGPVRPDTVLGKYEIDLTSIYFSPSHEVIMVSLCLDDPDDKVEGIAVLRIASYQRQMGFLKVSIEVLGPNDEPTIHDPKEDKNPVGGATGQVLSSGKSKRRGHVTSLTFYKAEHLPMLDDFLGIDGYVVVKYAGITKGTKVITSARPVWNQRVNIGFHLPNQAKALNIEVWDYDLIGKNDEVGEFKLNFKDIQDKEIGARWVNLYGPPLSGKGEWAQMMLHYGYELGSHYRGRLLYSVSSRDEPNPKSSVEQLKFEFPTNPEPVAQEKTFVLRIVVYEAVMLPQRNQAIFQFQFGPYYCKTEPVPIENGRAQVYYSFLDKKVILPLTEDQMPDLIVYFADENEDSRRHSFARIKASELLRQAMLPAPEILSVNLKEDRSLDLVTDDEFPGRIFISATLYNKKPPILEKLSKPPYKPWQLRAHIFCARDLPAADETGSSDPYVKVQIEDKAGITKMIPATLNPQWFETITLDVDLPPFLTLGATIGMSVQVYDDDDGSDEQQTKFDLIGRSWIPIEEKWVNFQVGDTKHQIIYGKPTWHTIRYDATDQICGKILVGYALIPHEIKDLIPLEDIRPPTRPTTLHMFALGVRNIEIQDFVKPDQLMVKLSAGSSDKNFFETKPTRVENACLPINRYFKYDLELPTNKELCPLVDVSLFNVGWSDEKTLLGLGQISLPVLLDKFYLSRDKQRPKTMINLNTKEAEITTTKKKKENTKKKNNKENTKQKQNTVFALGLGAINNEALDTQGSVLNTFQIKSQEDIEVSKLSIDQEIDYDEVILENENKKPLTHKELQAIKKSGGKKGVFGTGDSSGLFKKEKFTYEDYDTDPEEDLDVIPEWLKDRESYNDELEDFLFKTEGPLIQSFPLMTGSLRGKSGLFKILEKPLGARECGKFKAIFIKEDTTELDEQGKQADIAKSLEHLKEKIKPMQVQVRLYVLEGRSLQEEGSDKPPHCFLKVKLGNEEQVDPRVVVSSDPAFYKRFEFVTTLPGAPNLEVSVWDKEMIGKDLVGRTEIDLEERFFSEAWKNYSRKPIEMRALTKPLKKGYFGRLVMWIDIVPESEYKAYPSYPIAPPEKLECELRVIVWQTQDVAYRDEADKANDLYLRGSLASDSGWQETDTHWKCRQKGSFNYRWKFPMTLPLDPHQFKPNILKVQLWDRDILDSDDMICEAEIDLNEHRLLDKVYKRREPVILKKKWKEKGNRQESNLWYNAYHPEYKDKAGKPVCQGKVQLTIELMPKTHADLRQNGIGRESTNAYPVLPQPTGRFGFDVLNPLSFIKEMLGEQHYKKTCCTCCTILCIVLVIYLAWFVAASIIGNKASK